MTNQTTQNDTSALKAVDRAAGDMRRGLPVLVIDGAAALLTVAAENLPPRQLTALRDMADTAPLYLGLPPERAQVLKLRQYTGDISWVAIDQPDAAALLNGPLSAATISALADPLHDLKDPLRGPFVAERTPPAGPGDAAIKLAKISNLLPGIVVASLDTEKAQQIAEQEDLLCVSADHIRAYDALDGLSLRHVTHARVPLEAAADTRLFAFRPDHGGTEHFAIVVGEPKKPGPVLVRLHSECFTGDLLGSLKCDCGDQLRGAIKLMGDEGAGIVLYLAQEGRGIGLVNKLRAYELQDQGYDTMEANGRLGFADDERLFEPAAAMLRQMGYTKIRLLTNNPDKVGQLEALGIEITERVTHKFPPNPHNQAYLMVKKAKADHDL
ncbi:MAG: GTP cyclohydrolase II [Alphaproteobacteria bacterium]